MIETPRLILRRWRDSDREPFAALHADHRVMDWLGREPYSRQQSDLRIDRFEAQFETLGYGFLALQRKVDAKFVGFVGLAPVDEGPPAPQGVEFVWRLSFDAWGQGYASEAAEAVMADGFGRVKLQDILAYTAATNLRSQSVMRRIGMSRRPDLDFDHPALAEDHPLRPHVVYSASAACPP